MTYEEVVAAAPPGWTIFALDDIERLPHSVRRRGLRAVPEEDIEAARRGDREADERVRRALFWTFVYNLRPELWDALAAAEPVHPEVLRMLHELGGDRGRVLEIGAGSGRLTTNLLASCQELLALDPSIALLRILRSRAPAAYAAAGWAEDVPIRDEWADVTVSCASVGMGEDVIGELKRATRRGGLVVLISPEQGSRLDCAVARFDPEDVQLPARDSWIDRVFGPPRPPSEVVWFQR